MDSAINFKAVGMSDHEQCEHCGRTNLKRTILIVALDADGNAIGEAMHYGVVCAARATGRKGADLEVEAASADRHAAAARSEVAEFIAGIGEFWQAHGNGSEKGLHARIRTLANRRIENLAGAREGEYAAVLRGELLKVVAG